jgi:hypothetical protein
MSLTDRLAEAEQALHDLNTGRNVVEVQDGAERVRYGVADRARLQSYIADLRRQIDKTSTAPMEFWGR